MFYNAVIEQIFVRQHKKKSFSPEFYVSSLRDYIGRDSSLFRRLKSTVNKVTSQRDYLGYDILWDTQNNVLKDNVVYKLPRPSGTPSKFEGDRDRSHNFGMGE